MHNRGYKLTWSYCDKESTGIDDLEPLIILVPFTESVKVGLIFFCHTTMVEKPQTNSEGSYLTPTMDLADSETLCEVLKLP